VVSTPSVQARGRCSEYDASVQWLEAAREHYSICYIDRYSADVPFAEEWMDHAVQLMQDKYGVTDLFVEGLPLNVNVALLPAPNDDASVSTTRFRCCWGYGESVGGAYQRAGWYGFIPYLTPSHSAWDASRTWGGMRLPPDDYHAKNIVHEFTHAIQYSFFGTTFPWPVPQWVFEGMAEYEGMFNATEYNRTDGFDSLVRYGHRYIDRFECCGSPSTPTLGTSDIYFGGALIMKYLADTFGEDMHVRFVRHQYSSFDEALAAEIEEGGSTVQETYDGLLAWLRQRYASL